ncbi:MAG TPA: hypothetical protein VLA19_11985 [Herpetosiphonaceae bacterium]|nr:hypothetical protein [Herpetosiphonaceae bacterium]
MAKPKERSSSGKSQQQSNWLSPVPVRVAVVAAISSILVAVVTNVPQYLPARNQNRVVVPPTALAALSTSTATMTTIPTTTTAAATDVPPTATVTPPTMTAVPPTETVAMTDVPSNGTVGPEASSSLGCGDGFVDLGDEASEKFALSQWKEEVQNNQPPSESGDTTVRTVENEWAKVDICVPNPKGQYLLTIEIQNSECSLHIFNDTDYVTTLKPDPGSGDTKRYQESIFVKTGEASILFQNPPANACAAPGVYNVGLQLQP